MTIAFTFPGQGSQAVGMGREIVDTYPAAKKVFEEVDDALDQRLSDIILNGPDDLLTSTAHAQPALMAVSIATMRALEAEGVVLKETASYVAGHSLGEYSALAAADALTLGDAAKLLRIRGNAMQAAVPAGEGAMAAIMGLDQDALGSVVEEAAALGPCEIANDNGGGQIVISGAASAVEKACEIAKDRGAKRALLLPVSAPFHCSLMQPAADAMKQALDEVVIYQPSVPVVANVTVAPLTQPAHIRQSLVDQVTGQVRWREIIEWFSANGVDRLLEVGSGKVLTGLARRIDRSLDGMPINTPEDVQAVAAKLTGAPAPERLP
ncbi:MAG: ACP S-malonyltransferase [Pseudomonadota bacterium]